MQTVILALGLVLIFEGLVFALAPRRLDDLLRAMADLPFDARRMIGVLAITAGLVVIVLARRI
ncbi:MAG: DUF2065 domain-containing protein [Rhodobacteraceae bacterium]|nr:MAG: DUF2065 domain-containing protein [Paracoccaceae bacterium]